MRTKKHIRKRTRMVVKMLLQKFGKISKKIIGGGGGGGQRFRYLTKGGGILLTLRTVTGGGGPNFRQKQCYVTFE